MLGQVRTLPNQPGQRCLLLRREAWLGATLAGPAQQPGKAFGFVRRTP